MSIGPSDAVDLRTVSRALVVKLRHHGDVLLTSPVFSVLKHRAPHIGIDALVYEDTREMLTGHPAIDEVIGIGRNRRALGAGERLRLEWALLQKLRERNYQLLIHLSEHPRGAWLSRYLGCRYAVAPGLRDRSEFWRRSFTHRFPMPLGGRRHMVEWNLDALRRIGVQPGAEERALLLVPGEAAEAEAETLLAREGLVAGAFIHVHPASRWSFKCWPAERNAALIDALTSRGERVVLTAGRDESELAFVRDIVSRCAVPPVDLAGRLSLKSLAALTARARLFVGVDSAPMHIAAAMGTPVVALFGPSGEADWGPWSAKARVVASDRHPCRPCGIDGCGGGKVSDCLVTLPEARVLSAVEELLCA
jgi:heptosyltransferase-3